MSPSACCISSEDHGCDLIIVHGDTLRGLLSSAAVDRAIHSHVDGSLDGEFPVMFLCKDDLALHLGNVADRDDLEDFLAMLLAGENIQSLQVELGCWEEVGDESICASPMTTEYGRDRDLFQDQSDLEPLLTEGPFQDPATCEPILLEDPFRDPSDTDTEPEGPRRLTGERRKAFRARLASINHRSRSPLRQNYHRIPEVVPECPPKGDCSTCRKCEEAVDYEW